MTFEYFLKYSKVIKELKLKQENNFKKIIIIIEEI